MSLPNILLSVCALCATSEPGTCPDKMAIQETGVSNTAIKEIGNKPDHPKVKLKILRSDKLAGKLDGRPMKSTLIEVVLPPGAYTMPHRHPGAVTGYVLEGALDFQIDDDDLQKLSSGDTFFEPAMCLHRVAHNRDPARTCRLLVTMVHPADAKQLMIPEPPTGRTEGEPK